MPWKFRFRVLVSRKLTVLWLRWVDKRTPAFGEAKICEHECGSVEKAGISR